MVAEGDDGLGSRYVILRCDCGLEDEVIEIVCEPDEDPSYKQYYMHVRRPRRSIWTRIKELFREECFVELVLREQELEEFAGKISRIIQEAKEERGEFSWAKSSKLYL